MVWPGHHTPNGPGKLASISMALNEPATSARGLFTTEIGHAITIAVGNDDTLHPHNAVHGHGGPVLLKLRRRTQYGARAGRGIDTLVSLGSQAFYQRSCASWQLTGGLGSPGP